MVPCKFFLFDFASLCFSFFSGGTVMVTKEFFIFEVMEIHSFLLSFETLYDAEKTGAQAASQPAFERRLPTLKHLLSLET